MDRQSCPYSDGTNIYPPILAKIPPEVACHIFEYACERIGDINDTGTMRVAISQVCREWRCISLAHTSMWASFSYTATDQNHRLPVYRLKSHLDRSGVQSLNIFLDMSCSRVAASPATDMIKVLIPHVERWRSIDIYINGLTSTEGIFESLAEASVPRLEALTFHRTSFLPWLEPAPQKVFRGGAPQLTYLHMDPCDPWPFLPPLSNIKTLFLDGHDHEKITMPWSLLIDLLQLPLLSSVSVSYVLIEREENERAPTNPIIMNSITHLRINNSDDVTDALSYLDAPRLEFLEHFGFIMFESAPFRNTFPALKSLLFEFRPGSSNFDFPLLWNLFQQAPNLTHLIIMDIGPFFIDFASKKIREWHAMLEPPNTKTLVWPALERITLNVITRVPIQKVYNFVDYILESPPQVRPRLTLELDPRTIDRWRRCETSKFELLQRRCSIVGWNLEELSRARARWDVERAGKGSPRLFTERTASLFEFCDLYDE